MQVSGFTFLKDAEVNGYPFVESILSLLPIVDEMIVVIGDSSDATRLKVQEILDPKIRIIDSHWNPNMRDRGFVYGQQKMIGHYNCTGDWAFYLEGDEVLHEKDYPLIMKSMEENLQNDQIEALVFDFLHFYGTPDQVGIAGYRKAPRIIRNSIRVFSPDGLYFLVLDKNKKGRYPRAAITGASIYHYGHCRSCTAMNRKVRDVGQYWGNDKQIFEGYGHIDLAELRPFPGDHPSVMTDWLDSSANKIFEQSSDYRTTVRDRRNRLRFWLEEQLGCEISKKHYSQISK